MLDPSRQPGTSPHRGLALALGLARSIVQLDRGSVGVEERGPSEAVFVVNLPVEPAAKAPSASAESASTPRRCTKSATPPIAVARPGPPALRRGR